MSLVVAFVYIACTLFGIFIIQLRRQNATKKFSLPPGPRGLPIIGNMHQMGNDYVQTTKWSKMYDGCYTIGLLNTRAIIIHDVQLLKEYYNHPVFNGRMDLEIVTIMANGPYGLVSSNGKSWEEQRRFVVRLLRDYGFGRKSMEALLMEDVKEFIHGLDVLKGQPIQIVDRFNLPVVNSLWSIMIGNRFKHDDAKLNNIMTHFLEASGVVQRHQWMILIPWVMRYFSKLSGWGKIQRVVNQFHHYLHEMLDQNLKLRTPGEPKHFVDAFLDKIDDTTDPDSIFYWETGHKILFGALTDFFTAGFTTTAFSLNWLMYYVAAFPEIQNKMQEEIERIIGSSRLPSLYDKENMPFTNAFFMEVHRHIRMVPFAGFRIALYDNEFKDYTVPEGTLAIINTEAIMSDPKLWDDPESFRPERFLSPNGSTLERNQNWIIFSLGRRACPGETMSRDASFLYLTSIIQKFNVRHEPGKKCSNKDWDFKFFMKCPKPFSLTFVPR